MTLINIIPFRNRLIDPDAAPSPVCFCFLHRNNGLSEGRLRTRRTTRAEMIVPLSQHPLPACSYSGGGKKSDTSLILLRKAQSAKAASGMSYWNIFI